ncbi:DUF2795 domain-containing protein [Streptomyces sp. NPDC001513]|uniref:DUF2795 domain-containing protein n=1 Tax=Streptomyces sp. NPDC001513 TaxID=3364580 RepID=UPI0036B2D0AD
MGAGRGPEPCDRPQRLRQRCRIPPTGARRCWGRLRPDRLVKKWPATKQDIITAAKNAGSPKAAIAALKRLPKDAYQDAATLMKDLL